MYFIAWDENDDQKKWYDEKAESKKFSSYDPNKKYPRFSNNRSTKPGMKDPTIIHKKKYKRSTKNNFTTLNRLHYALNDYKYAPLKKYEGKFSSLIVFFLLFNFLYLI